MSGGVCVCACMRACVRACVCMCVCVCVCVLQCKSQTHTVELKYLPVYMYIYWHDLDNIKLRLLFKGNNAINGRVLRYQIQESPVGIDFYVTFALVNYTV